jgi:hypothetical protein
MLSHTIIYIFNKLFLGKKVNSLLAHFYLLYCNGTIIQPKDYGMVPLTLIKPASEQHKVSLLEFLSDGVQTTYINIHDYLRDLAQPMDNIEDTYYFVGRLPTKEYMELQDHIKTLYNIHITQ